MPTRYLKPEYRDSGTINSLTDSAEALWCRLLVTVDDYGRFDARPAFIKSQCYPIKDSVTAADCDRLLAELDAKGAIVAYLVDGRPYLQMQKWANTPRASKSKFPAFADECTRVYAGVRTPPPPAPPAAPAPKPERVRKAAPTVDAAPAGFVRFWAAWPRSERKGAKGKCVEAWQRGGFEQLADKIVEHVVHMTGTAQWRDADGKYIPAPLVYLNNRRWEGFGDDDGGGSPGPAPWAGGV